MSSLSIAPIAPAFAAAQHQSAPVATAPPVAAAAAAAPAATAPAASVPWPTVLPTAEILPATRAAAVGVALDTRA